MENMTKTEQFNLLEGITLKTIKGRAEMLKQKVLNAIQGNCAAFRIEELCKSEAYTEHLMRYERLRNHKDFENRPFDAYLEAMKHQERVLFSQADGEFSTSAAYRCNAHYKIQVARELMQDPLYQMAKDASAEYKANEA